MKLNVERPEHVVDINRLPLDKIENLPDGGLKIGATVRNTDLAHHGVVKRDYAVLSQALLSGATAQLRNMATTAGNLSATDSLRLLSAIRHGPAISASPVPAARPSTARIARWRSWGQASIASPPIRRI